MKKIISFLMVFVMLLAVMPIASFVSAKEFFCDDDTIVEEKDGFYYTIFDNEAVIVDWSNSLGADIVIPASLGGYPVTYIIDDLFGGCDFLNSVTVSDGITNIGIGAFKDCENLSVINIPDSVTSIEMWAFLGTAWYENQPDGIVYAGKVACDYKGEMGESIVIKDGTLGIANDAFCYSENLKTVFIPESVVEIGDCAFEYCPNLEKIEVDENNQNYVSVDGVLYDKNQTTVLKYPPNKTETSYTMPETLKVVGKLAFEDCENLTEISFNEGLETIKEAAFWNCDNIEGVTLPNSVIKVEDYAFFGCWSMNYVNIGSGLTEIRNSVFEDCHELVTVNFSNCDNITSIGYSAFSGCHNLESIELGKNLTTISGGSFNSCITLTEIDIPNGVTNIEIGAFARCNSLEKVIIPQSVVSIGDGAFANCQNLTEVTVPNTIEEMGSRPFYDTPWFNSLPDGPVYFGKVLNVYKGVVPKSFTVKDGTTYISSYAFLESDNEAFENITIPSSVKYIGSNVFETCDALKNVYIEDMDAWFDVDIEEYRGSFLHDYDLYLNGELVTEVVVPETVTQVKNSRFGGCRSITSVTLHKNITDIAWSAFEGAANLKDIYYRGSEAEKENISIENFVIDSNYDRVTWHYNSCISSAEHSVNGEGKCGVCGEMIATAGDLDGNGKVDTTDLATIKLVLAGLNKLEGAGLIAGDLDGDGEVNTTDLATLKLKLAGIE